jgi:hypothetical protein
MSKAVAAGANVSLESFRGYFANALRVHDLTIAEHVVTVTGKAFYDIAHAPADHSNRRHSPKDYAVWEIHPVMKLEVIQ